MSKKQLLIVYAGHTSNGSTSTIANWIAGNNNPNQVIQKFSNENYVCVDQETNNPECKNTTSGPVGAMKYVNVIIKLAKDATADDIDNADAIVLGSGTYNGNPEPAMIEFVDSKLGAGKAKAVLAGKICGTFCTSAGYATGAQPVLNSLARLAMTFGATFVGGGNWHTSQGICGMVKDNIDGTWEWDSSMKYLQEDAQAYGERLGMITSFFSDAYTKASGIIPENPGYVITCNTKPVNCKIGWILLPAILVSLILFIIFNPKKRI